MAHDVAMIRLVACLCLGVFAFCPGSLIASELSFGAELDGNSRYVWLGPASSEGPVLQPSAWVSLAGRFRPVHQSSTVHQELLAEYRPVARHKLKEA